MNESAVTQMRMEGPRKASPTKRKSKGKQHSTHAQTLINIAHNIGHMPIVTPHGLADIFTKEAKRLRGILR